MADRVLNLLILWHQHQPQYQDLRTHRAVMPWVRLHAVKDYYDMAVRIPAHENVRVTFNLVPTLIEQMEMYASGSATDEYLEISATPACSLTPAQKRFAWEHFFEGNLHRMVLPHPRYRELYHWRPQQWASASLEHWSEQDWRDLQVWHNLVWCDPWFGCRPGIVRDLHAKGGGFTEAEKHALLAFQMEVLREVIPLHRRLQDAGHIEIATTPYAHPILPLLADMTCARQALPGLPMPDPLLEGLEDAAHQVRQAVEIYQRCFACAPRGMWPAEGSVSDAAIGLFRAAGLQWIATDEGILSRSLNLNRNLTSTAGEIRSAVAKVHPWLVQSPPGQPAGPAIFFRDVALSDLIGFEYAHWDADKAADDFIARLEASAHRIPTTVSAPVVSVILDGENCWENYAHDGNEFLAALYQRLSAHNGIRCVLPANYLQVHPPKETLPGIWAGSWINSDFSIWIGHEDDRTAWGLIARARQALLLAQQSKNLSPEALQLAWRCIFVAEGSDWFWWYGEDHGSALDPLFDELFRSYLLLLYQTIETDPPGSLYRPIGRSRTMSLMDTFNLPAGPICPDIDGQVGRYFEWVGSGSITPGATGAMHQQQPTLSCLHYGWDEQALFVCIRLATAGGKSQSSPESIEIEMVEPVGSRLSLTLGTPASAGWVVAADSCLEARVPWSLLGIPGERLGLRFHLNWAAGPTLALPATGLVQATIPGIGFPSRLWLV